jgi:hypothetical protein
MSDDTETKQSLLAKWGTKAGAIAAILGMVAAVFVFDDRYEKAADADADQIVLTDQLTNMQTSIISEMRVEVTKNRSAMISNMQLDADDIEYEISQIERRSEEVPRHLIDKHKQILRDIEELKAGEPTN